MSNRSLLGVRDKRKNDIGAGGNAFVEGFNILETSNYRARVYSKSLQLS